MLHGYYDHDLNEDKHDFAELLSQPDLLPLSVKQAWLHSELAKVVQNSDADTISLVAMRGNVLEGLCDALGVDEGSGAVRGTQAQGIEVQVRQVSPIRIDSCWSVLPLLARAPAILPRSVALA